MQYNLHNTLYPVQHDTPGTVGASNKLISLTALAHVNFPLSILLGLLPSVRYPLSASKCQFLSVRSPLLVSLCQVSSVISVPFVLCPCCPIPSIRQYHILLCTGETFGEPDGCSCSSTATPPPTNTTAAPAPTNSSTTPSPTLVPALCPTRDHLPVETHQSWTEEGCRDVEGEFSHRNRLINLNDGASRSGAVYVYMMCPGNIY